MSEEGSLALAFDVTVLSKFASSNSIDWLTTEFDQLYTVPAVRDEIDRGIEGGHTFLEPAQMALEAGRFQIAAIDSELADRFESERNRLDRGEFEAFLLARKNGWTLVTDDAAGRQVTKDKDVDVTGSIGLLVRGVVRGGLSLTLANEWLHTWTTERGYYAPVDNVGDVLPDGYE
ncbi:hypothetical protein C457_11026 [Haloferax prahovense DSM 18310]|uniref:DUF3368 domain-containing protein n=1 Tax=Haloferax prahovense (strain DSM 18310 / JCM 13924 / TL6) TaxID=1227461 RepID=M0GD31_HALPT|nr:hypothetical protein [Haloferax prahovense]ELZ68724.1 hypothetical protein C457_11026 [Haloferax prahovense DSM 18310]